VSDAARALVAERFLLEEDAARYITQAETGWPASTASSR